MHCPKCNENISVMVVRSNSSTCNKCGAELTNYGEASAHFFAICLIVIELGLIFSLAMDTWVNLILISFFALFNYYLGFRLFLRVKLREM
jgi:uncharacterized protein (DUF983 family)